MVCSRREWKTTEEVLKTQKNASPRALGETQALKTNQFETKRGTESKGLNFSDILEISN
jgi:hypothetical protein